MKKSVYGDEKKKVSRRPGGSRKKRIPGRSTGNITFFEVGLMDKVHLIQSIIELPEDNVDGDDVWDGVLLAVDEYKDGILEKYTDARQSLSPMTFVAPNCPRMVVSMWKYIEENE